MMNDKIELGEPDVIRNEDNILWLRAQIERLEAALAKSCEEGRAEMYDCGFNGLKAEIERLEGANKILGQWVEDKDKQIAEKGAVVGAAQQLIEQGLPKRTTRDQWNAWHILKDALEGGDG